MMTNDDKAVNRSRLLYMIEGKPADDFVKYSIEFSTDIHGENLIIWSGHTYTSLNYSRFTDDPSVPLRRTHIQVEPYGHLNPYTTGLYQIACREAERISDETLIEEYLKFREEHPFDGWGLCDKSMMRLGDLDSDEPVFEMDRNDKNELVRQIQERNRRTIREMWGVEVPLDLSKEYDERMSKNMGMVSEWFRKELTRIGGDYQKCFRH